MTQSDFAPTDGIYLLNHSVGLPLKNTKAQFDAAFFTPWEAANADVWPRWLGVVDRFRGSLADLFNACLDDFCPQTNLSSGLTKLVMSLDRLQIDQRPVLMSEIDFPSIGFVLQHALPGGVDQIRFVPKSADVTDPAVWAEHLSAELGMVVISQAYSNTGQQAPVAEILPLARELDVYTTVDVAQAAGIIPFDLSHDTPDFMIGSSIKWLCGGPGAGYLWVNPDRLAECKPVDVGWWSHEQPFEFNIHDFRYHETALKFWGGTPSVAPFVIAANSIATFAEIGSAALRAHNQKLISLVADALDDEFVSPREEKRRNGTMILNFGERQSAAVEALAQARIQVDQRVLGMRVSPHLYNTEAEIRTLLEVLKQL